MNVMNSEDTIYRYLDIESYLYVLQNRCFPVSKIASWPDSFEGTKYDFLRKAKLSNNQNVEASRVFASCWTLQNEDRLLYDSEDSYLLAQRELARNGSAAMWSAYCPRGGVRLKTSISKVLKATEEQSNLRLLGRGEVYYEAADDWKSTTNRCELVDVLLHKRVSFRHESEYRFVFSGPEDSDDHYFIPVQDFFDFFDEVLVSPATFRTSWISRTIYNVSVRKSINYPGQATVNNKNGNQYCRISQLYDLISEEVS